MDISKAFVKNHQTWVKVSNIFPNDSREFLVRLIPAEKTTDGEDLLIAGDELESAIRNPNKDWNDAYEGFYHEPMFGLSADEVEKICRNTYDEIFFFTDNTTLNYEDDMLLEDMKNENPDYFI